MPRTTLSHGPVVVVGVDGRIASWCDGRLAGDNRMKGAARSASERGEIVHVWRASARADLDTAVGAAAALASFRPGRARLIDPPAEVQTWFREHRTNCADDTESDF